MILKDGYNKNIPPIRRAEDGSAIPANVSISITLMKVVEVEETDHSIHLQFEIILQCTMVLAIENKERKICKSKWLDFTHFSTNYYFFGLYCCETANI